MNPTTQHSLLGTATLALILGCLEPADSTDGRTLEEAVQDMLGEPTTP